MLSSKNKQKTAYVAWLHLHEMSRTGKETFLRTRGRGEIGSDVFKFLFGMMETFQLVVMVAQHCEYTKITEFYTLK